MKRAARLLCLILVAGVAAQVAWAEVPFLHHRSPGLPPTVAASTINTPSTDFIRAHVPAGQSIVYDTGTHNNGDLFSYFLLSTVLVARNRVWWVSPAPMTSTTDWWQDVSPGATAIRGLAARVHARYVVFAGAEMPTNLPVAAVWRMDAGLAVVELAAADGT